MKKKIQGANPNNADYTGTTPLMASLKYANNNVVQVLINHGCGMSCVDRSGNQALHWGCFTGNTHGVQLLIEYRPPKEKQAFHQSLSFNEVFFIYLFIYSFLILKKNCDTNQNWFFFPFF